MSEAIDHFRMAIIDAGLTAPDSIEADGKLHRFNSDSKRKDGAGWYVFHVDGVAAGIFGCWRAGIQSTWKADIGRKLTKEETVALRAAIAMMQRQRDEATKAGHEAAAAKAAALWEAATPATPEHGYLARKGIGAHGSRVIPTGKCAGWLAVPMRDEGGSLWNIERIAPEKPCESLDKMGLHQGKRTGLYFSIGATKGAAALLICEGFATGASLHEATGLPVAVAFNAGNLEPVAKVLRRKFSDLPMLICADDDWRTDGNPGRTKANGAALATGAAVVFPIFTGERGDKATDFNDLHQSEGLEAVQRLVMEAVEGLGGISGQTEAKGEVTSNDKAPADEEEGPPLFPPESERPRFLVLDDWEKREGRKVRPGVYWCSADQDKQGNITLSETWFCSPLHLDAITFDGQCNNFGRLLRLKNTLGNWRTWAMPMEMLRGSGEDLRGELLAMGVELDPYEAKRLLPVYLQREHPKKRMHCAMQTGWAGKSFVLPDEVIGPDRAGVIFQSGERAHEEHTQAGTLASWQEGIGTKASGNPLLVLALSSGFAGPMLARCNAEGGGVHFVGDSSTGKTTAIEAACSIWGGPNYRRSWRATANGMEGAAALFNDCLLALDEISECDPKEVGAIVYALGNGRGKQRASRSGTARGVVRWRCFVLSSGERTIATTMAEGGHRVKAGQSVRLLDVPVNRTYGAWDDLHGAPSASAFSDAIKRTAAAHHGLVGRAFLEKLTHDLRDFCALLEEAKALFTEDDSEGQDKRAAGRFALIGLAGELATEYGLTGWQEGEAASAAALAFTLWRSERGRGNSEKQQIAERLSDFIERHGDGRFSTVDSSSEVPINNRAGWWLDGSTGREYLLTSEAMREALKGFDFKRALDALQELGALPAPGADGKRARPVRIGGRVAKLYQINPDKLAVVDHAA